MEMHDNQMEDDGKAEWSLSPGVQAYGDLSPSLPGSQQLWEVAEGLWWLVAWCGSPQLEITLEGPLTSSRRVVESWGDLAHGPPAC